MEATTLKTVARGKYYWEMVFNYDNSKNTGTINDKFKKRIKRTVNYRNFLSEKFNVKTGFKFNQECSVSLKFAGIANGSEKTEYGYHIELANELQKTSETNETIEEEEEFEKEFTVGPGGKLSLYRLCYVSDGVLLKTDTLATEPANEIIINLNFTYVKHILGLRDILNQFRRTRPGRSNKVEWKRIRNSIVQYADKTEEEAFRHFVETLQTITPGRENKVEWAAIRATCGEILNDWDAREKQLLLKKLATGFSTTFPGHANKVEWAKINKLSEQILNGLQPIF